MEASIAEFKLYTPEELAERNKPKRQQKRDEKERQVGTYMQALAGARPGFAGELTLSEGDDKRKLRALLKEAAQRNQQQLRFRPIKDAARIEFSVIESTAAQPTGQGRGGRRKQRA